jgi:hypothetical protein
MCMGRALIIVDNCWAIFEQLVIINGYCVRVHEIERCSMASMQNLWSVQGSPCTIREPLYIYIYIFLFLNLFIYICIQCITFMYTHIWRPMEDPRFVCGLSVNHPSMIHQLYCSASESYKTQHTRVYPCVFFSVCISNVYCGSPCVFPCVSVCIFGSPCVIPCVFCAVRIFPVCIFSFHRKTQSPRHQKIHAQTCFTCLQIPR